MAAERFKRGDHVSWSSEAGRVRGKIARGSALTKLDK